MMRFRMSGFKTALRASLAAVLLMTMLLSTAVPAGAASSPVSSAIAPAGTPGNTLDFADANGGEKLLQFTSGSHVLGFSRDGVIIASADHMLKTEFIGSRAAAPETDTEVSTEKGAGMASPLSRVTYQDVWDGVTVVYEASPGAIVESTYYINATEDGVPVERIRLGYNRPVSLDQQGNLVIAYETGTMVESAPLAWQEIDGQRKPVTVAYALHNEREVGFSLGDYIPGIPVVIDPTLTWNTFLGGSGNDYGMAIAVDGSGNVYVAGFSSATWGSPVRPYAAGWDAFAAKLNSSGGLTWNTFLGGGGHDQGYGIAVDGSGNVYVAGHSSTDWGSPVRPFTVGYDAFAARLDSLGVLTWNTFLGGSGTDYGEAIAVDGSGNVYVAGYSYATWQGTSAPVRAYTLLPDAFAARLDSLGVLTWNTFLGGSGTDAGHAIAVDGSGNVYVAGSSSATWQGTSAPVRAFTLGDDAFAARLTSSGGLTWNTFLGGSGYDEGLAIAVDGSGNVYVSGYSEATWGSPLRAYTSSGDAFAARLTSSGALNWNTFLGGTGTDYGRAIAVDGSGNVYVAGQSDATWGSPWRAYTLLPDAFAARLDSLGVLTWNTFLGGSGTDHGEAIAVDGSGNVYVGGRSEATWGSPVRLYTAVSDAFAAKLARVSTRTTNTATGTGIATFTTSDGSITGLTAMAQSALACTGNPGVSFPHGFFSFTINYIPPGSTVTITITLPSNMFTGTQYWKCINGQWVDCTSLLGSNDGDNILTLTIRDGGLGDTDGQANGTIVDPGGPGTLVGGGTSQGGAEGAATGESSSTTIRMANLRIAMLNVPGQAKTNQPITISANVVNDGSETGSTQVALKINGKIEQTKLVTVGGGGSRPVKFTVTKAEPGSYTVIMGSQRASFLVTGDGAKAAPALSDGAIAMLLLAVVVLAFVIILAFALRKKPTY